MAWGRLATGSGFTKGKQLGCKLGRGCVARSRLALFGELGIHGRKLKKTYQTPHLTSPHWPTAI